MIRARPAGCPRLVQPSSLFGSSLATPRCFACKLQQPLPCRSGCVLPVSKSPRMHWQCCHGLRVPLNNNSSAARDSGRHVAKAHSISGCSGSALRGCDLLRRHRLFLLVNVATAMIMCRVLYRDLRSSRAAHGPQPTIVDTGSLTPTDPGLARVTQRWSSRLCTIRPAFDRRLAGHTISAGPGPPLLHPPEPPHLCCRCRRSKLRRCRPAPSSCRGLGWPEAASLQSAERVEMGQWSGALSSRSGSGWCLVLPLCL